MANACEIELKDGRIINAKSCWEEDGRIKYEKYGAIVSLEKEKVKKFNNKDFDEPKIQKEKIAKNSSYHPNRINFKEWAKIDSKNYQGWSKCFNNCRNERRCLLRGNKDILTKEIFSKYIACKERCNENFHPIFEAYEGEGAYPPKSQTNEARLYRRNCGDDCSIARSKCIFRCYEPYNKSKHQTLDLRNKCKPCADQCKSENFECRRACK